MAPLPICARLMQTLPAAAERGSPARARQLLPAATTCSDMGRSIMMARHALVPLLVGIVLLTCASSLWQQTGDGAASATPAAVATPSVVTEVLSVLPTALPATPSPLQASVPVSAVPGRFPEATPRPPRRRARLGGHLRGRAGGLHPPALP